MDKILILYNKKDTYFFNRINGEHIYIENVFLNKDWMKNKILSFFRKTESPLTRLFYGKWYKNLSKYKKVIVLDTPFLYDRKLLNNISAKYKGEKYYYSWNIVRNEKLLDSEKKATLKNGFEFYCYDHNDCNKYGMKFNTIMYDQTLTLSEQKILYDTFFLGFLKDRKDKMISLYRAFENSNLIAKFVIVKHGNFESDLPFEYLEEEIGYYEYLEKINHSRSILDITQTNQDGYSMRVMESIYLNKKLITTNEYIKDDNLLYNPNNILVIDLDKTTEEQIRQFFDKPFEPYSAEIREYYSIEKWVDRFR